MPDDPFPLNAQNANRQGHLIRHLLHATDDETRERCLEALRAILPSRVRVYYNSGLQVYYERDLRYPVGYPFSKHLSFSAIYIEEVLPDGSANVTKSLLGPHKLFQTTEPRPLTALDVIQGDEYD